MSQIWEERKMLNIVAEIRKSHGMTQFELAQATGTSREHISRIESGNCSPSLELADKIASALKTDVYTLFSMESKDEHDRKMKDYADARMAEYIEKLSNTAKALMD